MLIVASNANVYTFALVGTTSPNPFDHKKSFCGCAPAALIFKNRKLIPSVSGSAPALIRSTVDGCFSFSSIWRMNLRSCHLRRAKRDECQAGKITLEEFDAWLEQDRLK